MVVLFLFPCRKAELAETVESLKKEILSKAEGYYSSPEVQAVFVKVRVNTVYMYKHIASL